MKSNFFNELFLDLQIIDSIKKYDIKVQTNSFDILMEQIRFEGMRHFHKIFHPNILIEQNEQKIVKKKLNILSRIINMIFPKMLVKKILISELLCLLKFLHNLKYTRFNLFLNCQIQCYFKQFSNLCIALQVFLRLSVKSATVFN